MATTGPGLLKYIEDDNAVPYNPFFGDYLTEEEMHQFDDTDWTEEEKQKALEFYAKLEGKEIGDPIEVIGKALEGLWKDKADTKERKLVLHVGSAGEKIFQEYINKIEHEL